MRVGAMVVLTISVILTGAGCAAPKIECAGSIEHGRIVLLPGVESSSWQFRGVVRGLREAGVQSDVEIIEWGDRPLASMRNLMNIEKNLERAKDIARRIAEFAAAHPACPITLVGYSGGGGMAVFVAEALPSEVMLERVILVGAAVDPKRDLAKTLAHCRQGVVNFYSGLDWFMLGLGTSVFGTMDRAKPWSAGSVGVHDAAGDLRCESGLTQIAWCSDWVRLGHYGGHVGWLARGWAREHLSKLVKEHSDTSRATREEGITQ